MPGTLNTPAPTDPIKANGFYSFVVTIPNDDVYSFKPKGTHGHIFLASDSSYHHGMFWWRTADQSKYAGGPNTVGLRSVLTGTTGTAGNTTLGVSEGVLYIENRSGVTRRYTVTLFVSNSSYE